MWDTAITVINTYWVSKEFVPFFFGKGYEPVVRLMQVDSVLFAILSLGELLGCFLIAMNYGEEIYDCRDIRRGYQCDPEFCADPQF